MTFPVSINQDCFAYAELLTGNHFADGRSAKMADVPDNAPERECLIKIFEVLMFSFLIFSNTEIK